MLNIHKLIIIITNITPVTNIHSVTSLNLEFSNKKCSFSCYQQSTKHTKVLSAKV